MMICDLRLLNKTKKIKFHQNCITLKHQKIQEMRSLVNREDEEEKQTSQTADEQKQSSNLKNIRYRKY